MSPLQHLPACSLLAQGNGGDGLGFLFAQPLVPLVVIGVLFYFMLIRPERRKRADLEQMIGNLQKNDRVVTVGGIFGTVVNVQKGSEDVTLKVDESNNTRLRVLRSSIARVVTAGDGSEKKEKE